MNISGKKIQFTLQIEAPVHEPYKNGRTFTRLMDLTAR